MTPQVPFEPIPFLVGQPTYSSFVRVLLLQQHAEHFAGVQPLLHSLAEGVWASALNHGLHEAILAKLGGLFCERDSFPIFRSWNMLSCNKSLSCIDKWPLFGSVTERSRKSFFPWKITLWTSCLLFFLFLSLSPLPLFLSFAVLLIARKVTLYNIKQRLLDKWYFHTYILNQSRSRGTALSMDNHFQAPSPAIDDEKRKSMERHCIVSVSL